MSQQPTTLWHPDDVCECGAKRARCPGGYKEPWGGAEAADCRVFTPARSAEPLGTAEEWCAPEPPL